MWCGALLAPIRLVFWLRGSSVKIGFLQYFPEFFLKVGFLHKNKDTRAILLKTALARVSCVQNTQIRGETTAKVFEKVDTFWIYHRPVCDTQNIVSTTYKSENLFGYI
jgi:hypothetical protein